MVTVCEWFGLKTTRTVFAGLASKPVTMVSISLASTPVATFSDGLTSKYASTVSGGLASKPVVTVSSGLTSKPTAMVFSGLALKPMTTGFSSLASKLVATVFSSLALKLVATVSPGLASNPVMGFLVEPQNQGGGGFSDLCLKIGSFGLVIWSLKSPRRFLSLGLKTKWDSVYQLCHKTDGGRSAWDTRRDLAAFFAWKQV
jgi:hypothetical protein